MRANDIGGVTNVGAVAGVGTNSFAVGITAFARARR
jgi:hypothetical protein